MNSEVPLWITYLSALLTPIIGIGVLVIAFFQWQTNRNRLKMELFDRRYRVYNSTKDLIDNVITNRTLELDREEDEELILSISSGQFLFDDEMAEYIKKLSSKSVNLALLKIELRNLKTEKERSKIAKECDEISS